MGIFDLIILAILALLTLRGIWKGMISQIVSVASLFIAWIVATRFGSLVAPAINVEPPWNQVLAMASVFIITVVAIRFAHAAFEKLIKHWYLKKIDTLLGGVLGFAKGLLICLIITFFAVMFSETSRAIIFNSQSGVLMVRLIAQIGVFVPKDSYEFVHVQLASFQDKIEQADALSDTKPDALLAQHSDTMQQVLGQLRQVKEPTKMSADSLWTALKSWWNGSPDVAEEAIASSIPDIMDLDEMPALSASVYTALPVLPQHPVATQSSIAVEDFFVRRADADISSIIQQAAEQIETMQTGSALLESLPILPMLNELLPAKSAGGHAGSDMLLRSTSQPSVPSGSASVFRPQ
ncbi:MAG: CvpA family protein [Planctomycetaceae bacterium]|nr:CvpA family protein [Planctomycetaceae bacterium]